MRHLVPAVVVRPEVTGLIAGNQTTDNARNGLMFGTAFWASPVAQQIVATKSGACDDSCPDCIDIWAQTPCYHGARYRFTYRGSLDAVDHDNPISDADGALGNLLLLNGTRLTGTRTTDLQ